MAEGRHRFCACHVKPHLQRETPNVALEKHMNKASLSTTPKRSLGLFPQILTCTYQRVSQVREGHNFLCLQGNCVPTEYGVGGGRKRGTRRMRSSKLPSCFSELHQLQGPSCSLKSNCSGANIAPWLTQSRKESRGAEAGYISQLPTWKAELREAVCVSTESLLLAICTSCPAWSFIWASLEALKSC